MVKRNKFNPRDRVVVADNSSIHAGRHGVVHSARWRGQYIVRIDGASTCSIIAGRLLRDESLLTTLAKAAI